MLTLHGRTRACGFGGHAEYETIAAVKRAVSIPVVANGDIDTPLKARRVLAATGADAVMIGRAAQGRPWIFRQVERFLASGDDLPPPSVDELRPALQEHLQEHYAFYGREHGVRTARKHIIWYTRRLAGGEAFCERMNRIDEPQAQAAAVDDFLREHGSRFGALREGDAPVIQ
jgi:tRNA-dihydrouridine synthase B